MVFRTCLVCVACLLIPAINAEPQSQPQQHPQRLVYSNTGNGPPPRPQEQYSQGNYPQAAQSQAYQRPGPTYQAATKPVSIHQLPNPSPIQSPLARQQQQQQQQQHQQQQSGGLARQGAPSIVPSRQVSAEAVTNYNQAPGPIHPRPRFPLPPQNKYSSQVKSSQGQGSKQNQLTSEELEYEEELAAEQEPDRLTLLLQESKFSCSGKKDGYYADEGLHCEVFHYCQDGGKHSWMCPNNFAFHQVHLICVPPTSDNICKQSASYHFVNDYLYRPINEKEAQASNTSLKYADRYYPDGYTPGTPLEEMFANTDYQQVQYEPRAPPSHKQHGGRPTHNSPPNNRNVFYSPESINIPLSQRRPPPARAPQAAAPKSHNSQQQQQSYEEYEDEEY